MTRLRCSWWRRALAGLVLVTFAASCSSKNSSAPVAPVAGPTATLTGLVIGASGSGLPLAGVTLTASPSAGASATSNSFGIFTLAVPANSKVAITGRLTGFATHPTWVQLTTGETRAIALVLAPTGANQTVFTSAGGKVTDPVSKTAVTLPANFVTGTSTAQISVTGLDPTSQLVLAMPGTFAAQTLFGASAGLEPFAIAEVRAGDGAGGSFPLARPVVLELHIPATLATDPRMGLGFIIPCLRYDEADGVWKVFADGVVVSSSVDGQPAVRVTVNSLSWFAAGFLHGTNACVEGVVTSGGLPVGGASVQAYPGSSTVSDAGGAYRVSIPPGAVAQLVAVRAAAGTVNAGGASATGGKAGTPCVTAAISISGSAPPPTFTVHAQLHRGRDFIGIVRDAATVRIFSRAATPVPLSGARVELFEQQVGALRLPLRSPGVYGIISGQPGPFNLTPGGNYTLNIDLEPDGVVDGTAQVQMPARPTITEPPSAAVVGTSFNASWTDPNAGSLGYSVRYIGSIESGSFGSFPAIFALETPASSTTIGTGVGQPQFSMPNNPLIAGQYTFRLWATNGPVRYPVGNTIQFATPNIVTTRITGWFSAIAKADSVVFNSIGDGLP
ncbi:MAG: hypothetical protein ABIS67_03455 [Candidatus Eisenbacteria bacterium]